MAKVKFSSAPVRIDPTIKGTSIGRKPTLGSMNKDKRRSYKKYRGQGRP